MAPAKTKTFLENIKGNVFCLLALCFFPVSVWCQTASRPNILIIMTDQHTADAMSNAGNKDLHTPAMDKLAENGVRFTRAYCHFQWPNAF